MCLDLLISRNVAELLDGELLEILPRLLPDGHLEQSTASSVLDLAVGRGDLMGLELSLLAWRLANEHFELGVESSDDLGVRLDDLKKINYNWLILFPRSSPDNFCSFARSSVHTKRMFRLVLFAFRLILPSNHNHHFSSFHLAFVIFAHLNVQLLSFFLIEECELTL